MTTFDDEAAGLLFGLQLENPACRRLLQHLAERPEAVVGFAEAGFATLQGLLDHGTPYLLLHVMQWFALLQE